MLSSIFEEYIKVNKQYVDFVNELLNKDFCPMEAPAYSRVTLG